MPINITAKLVSSIKPDSKPKEIRDAQLKGLILRIQPSGTMTYYLEYKRGKRIAIGRAGVITPIQARDIAKTHLSDIYKGTDPSCKKQKAKDLSFRQFLDQHYKPYVLQNLRTGQATYDRLVASFKEFHNTNLNEISPLLAEKWRQRRQKDKVKSSTINRELSDLKAALTKAVLWEILEKHPLEHFKSCKLDNSSKIRFLTTEETNKLLIHLLKREDVLRQKRENYNEHLKARHKPLYPSLSGCVYADHVRPAVILSLHTGLRRGELFSLLWENVDFDRKLLTVIGSNAKSGKTRHVPLNSEALSVLKNWKSQVPNDAKYVFEGKNRKPFHDIRTSWESVLQDAEIINFRWHDLRHTFASNLVMKGVSLNTVRELLGHSDYTMTLIYAHLAPEHKSLEVEKLVTP